MNVYLIRIEANNGVKECITINKEWIIIFTLMKNIHFLNMLNMKRGMYNE